MEKKGNRSVQSAFKGLCTDVKKSQDVSNKYGGYSGRRREPNNGSASLFQGKLEPSNFNSRKPIPQKSKSLDKRPNRRGGFESLDVSSVPSSSQNTENESTRLEEFASTEGKSVIEKKAIDPNLSNVPEFGSVFNKGSKKQNLNHLVGFYFNSEHNSGGASNRTKAMQNRVNHHKFNKEHYIQANCQFLVNASGDYRQYMNNPDALVDWSLIEQVNMHVYELPSCPICLMPPVAAKVTRCGHIYCWSCLLHFLAYTEKNWGKCPICYDVIHKYDLKSVMSVPHASFHVNEIITFKLMKRAKGSLIAYPIEEHVYGFEKPMKLTDDQASKTFCKLLLADKNDIMNIIEREKTELSFSLEEGDETEKCFIEQAIASLQERENFLLTSNQSELVDDTPKTVEKKISENIKYYFFYQASDGQQIYLHGLNVRMLEHTYGSLEYCPHLLSGRIIEKECHTMDEKLRNKFRYLLHLPIRCQFEFAEIHLSTPVVSRDTLDYFASKLESRRKNRKSRAKVERQREKHIANVENRIMGKYPEANIELSSTQQFPDFCLSRDMNYIPKHLNSDSESTYDNAAVAMSEECPQAGPSFAKMASIAKTHPKSKPSAVQQNTSAPAKLINATGTQLLVSRNLRNDDNSDDEENEYIYKPTSNTFSDAFELALEKITHNNDKPGAKSGKKKKHRKKANTVCVFGNAMNYCS